MSPDKREEMPEGYFHSINIYTGGHKVTHHECSYCGGWDGPPLPMCPELTTFALHMEGEQQRKVCYRCLLKVYDTTLGDPK